MYNENMKNRFLLSLLIIPLLSSCKSSGPVDPLKVPLCFTCLSKNATVFVEFSCDEPDKFSEFLLESSKDNKHWSKVEPVQSEQEPEKGYAEIPFNKNEKIYFRSDNHSYNKNFHIGFIGGGDDEVAVSGNVMSLLSKTNFATNTTLPCDGCFYFLFCENESLVDASNLILPATTLTKDAYGAMFSSDIKLKTAPKLPATTLAESCYQDMFSGCDALQIATTGDDDHKIFTCPEGGAVCCDNMFDEDLIVEDNQTYYYL